METIPQIAKQAMSWFTTKKRRPEDEEEIVIAKDDAPEWIKSLSHEAHKESDGGYMFPDDWRYQFLMQALDAINEHEDYDDARASLEADIYTSELTGWLHSRNDRLGYVDDARAEFLDSKASESDAIGAGQLMEKWEVFDAVYHFLQEYMEELNDADDAE